MDKEIKIQGKRCFIITPIGDEGSDIFRMAKGVIESVIKPVLKEYGFDDIKPAYEINASGMINTQIINRIIDDDLVISNLTGNNPNVMYELCLRHVVAKPIIHICEKGTPLPFDIKDNRTIFYQNDMLGVEELKNSIIKYMDEITYDVEYMDNPIYTAYKYGKLLKETKDTEANEILKLLVNISSKVSEIQLANDNIIPQESIFYDFENSRLGKLTYSVESVYEDINTIDENVLQKVLSSTVNYKMRVHEMASELGIKSRTILQIAEVLGLSIRSTTSGITPEDRAKILFYIENNRIG